MRGAREAGHEESSLGGFAAAPHPNPSPTRGERKLFLSALLAGMAILAAPALAEYTDETGDVMWELSVPAGSRAEVYLGREPTLLLICLQGGTRASIDISSERGNRAVLERDECVLVSEREVFASVAAGDGAATVSVRVIVSRSRS
jgi:hypothetical protein